MAITLADRVKETTTTEGVGRLTFGGSTFGGFQTFSDAIGDGNKTYYCIQNFDRFEIGIGTYRQSDNTLSRDTVLQSSNSDNLVSLVGVSAVFCVIPAEKSVYLDEIDCAVVPAPFVLKRSDTGDYWQTFSTDYTNRVASFYLEESSDAVWTLGLKTSSSESVKPFYGYVSAKNGFVELKGNSQSILSIGDASTEGLQVDHQFQTIVDLRKNGGSISVQNLTLDTDETTTVQNSTISSNVFDVRAGVGHISDLQSWSVSTNELATINQYGDFETVGNIISPSGRFTAIRFSDNTIQTTAALPYSSGSLIDQNAQDIVTQSGYFQTVIDNADNNTAAISGYLQSYIDLRDAAISGWADSYITETSGNLKSQIDQVSSDLVTTSGTLTSAINDLGDDLATASGALRDSIDQTNADLATASGALRDSINELDSDLATASGALRDGINQNVSDISTVSGLLTPSGESFDFTSNILTYNNSYGGSFTADLSSLSTFDTSGVSLDYSAGILTYTNNAGGSFNVDLSSISGDVYAMIVGSAPETLDTLEEIAAALNDDENIANTLTTLITTTSGNLQAQIIDNDGDISQLNTDLSTVSGLLYDHWTVSDGTNSENIYAGETVSFSGVGGTFVSYDNLTNIVSISGASDPTGVVSGIAFFGDDGVLTGNGTLTYDGQNVEVDGFITASGERVITSEDIFHIVQLTQAEYDALTPDSATFYIITDAPSVSGYFEAENIALSGYFQNQTDQLNQDIITVSGLTPTGTPSGVTFFADDGSLSGNSAFIFDGQNITLDGYIDASGQRVITSPTVHHIVQLTQAEYDAITPDSATIYFITDSASVSGYFQTVTDDLYSDIITVSGLTPTGTPSGLTFFADDASLTGNNTLTYDGQDIRLSGTMYASGERIITSDEIFHIKQLTQAEYDAITPDSATFYIITDASEDAAVSGYFEARADQADADIATVSGLLASVNPTGTPSGISFFDDSGSLSGNSSFVFDGQNVTLDGYMTASGERVITSPDIHHIVQLTQAEYDALTPDSATFYIITDAPSISGYFEPRVTQNENDIATVSGLLDSVNPTGTPSGLAFFDDGGSLSGNNTLTYDGVDIALSGNILASGKRVITSDQVYHIEKLTQAEYDAITPDAATFYIITDPDIEGPVVQPYREVATNTTILSTDYTINATAGLVLTLPTAVGNGGLMYHIKNTSTGNVIVSGVGGETLDGQPSFEMSTQYQSIKVQSTNSNWIIL